LNNQYCELCQRKVDEVEPARVRDGEMKMVCTECRSFFDERTKVQWGRMSSQYYWDLGLSRVPILKSGYPRKFVELRLSQEVISILRASGYLVVVRDEAGGS
jgi:hypothetical protein